MAQHTLTLDISGMHCNGCVRRLTTALQPLADKVSVTLVPPRAVLTGSTAAAQLLSEAQVAASAAGKYSVTAAAELITPAAALAAAVSAQAVVAVPIVAVPIAPSSIAQKPYVELTTPNISWLSTYKPLLIILAYITGVTLAVQWAEGRFVLDEWMRHFMAGFFLVFSFFKLLDVRSFANAYAGYDLLAARWHGWGLVYPFVELALGVAYLFNAAPAVVHTATVVVMGFSSVGVILAVRRKQQIVCACLGSVFNLPMSTVTIIEDLTMVAMALWMLLA